MRVSLEGRSTSLEWRWSAIASGSRQVKKPASAHIRNGSWSSAPQQLGSGLGDRSDPCVVPLRRLSDSRSGLHARARRFVALPRSALTTADGCLRADQPRALPSGRRADSILRQHGIRGRLAQAKVQNLAGPPVDVRGGVRSRTRGLRGGTAHIRLRCGLHREERSASRKNATQAVGRRLGAIRA
jgi:hypothetical protein